MSKPTKKQLAAEMAVYDAIRSEPGPMAISRLRVLVPSGIGVATTLDRLVRKGYVQRVTRTDGPCVQTVTQSSCG